MTLDKFTKFERTDYCTELSAADCGKEVILYGWAQKQRDLGSLIFIDLRDRTGIIQISFDTTTDPAVFEKAKSVRNEYVLAVKGTVRMREGTAINTRMKTGDIEIFATKLDIINVSETPPIYIEENSNVNEAVRLKYRYLDLRRPDIQSKLILRHRVAQIVRRYYDENGFLEIETPVLAKSTPEGARDYLVPSRVQPGKFFALPQSPQLLKQLLMVSGYDRYFQIVKCFRDEDLRADRQPEFTQIDVEMSFTDEDTVMSVAEGMIAKLFKEIKGIELQLPLRRMPYKEAMERYGSDKPDLRFGMELIDVSEAVRNVQFPVFADTVKAGGYVRALNAKECGKFTRKEIDALGETAKTYRAKGIAWLVVNEDGTIKSSFNKFLNDEDTDIYLKATGAEKGDLICFVADNYDISCEALGQVRLEVGNRLGLRKAEDNALLWVTEFPLLEKNEEENRWTAKHHPFTMPYVEDLEYAESDPGRIRSRAYDIVWNGYEVGGGSIRIHDGSLQEKMFGIIGLSKEKAWNQFGFLLEAFKYGAPPHGGFAFGLDRLIMLLAGTNSIRDVIAFPKVQNASCLMTESPSYVDQKQLDELSIDVKDSAKDNADAKKI